MELGHPLSLAIWEWSSDDLGVPDIAEFLRYFPILSPVCTRCEGTRSATLPMELRIRLAR